MPGPRWPGCAGLRASPQGMLVRMPWWLPAGSDGSLEIFWSWQNTISSSTLFAHAPQAFPSLRRLCGGILHTSRTARALVLGQCSLLGNMWAAALGRRIFLSAAVALHAVLLQLARNIQGWLAHWGDTQAGLTATKLGLLGQ
jgi:hypothetical protein